MSGRALLPSERRTITWGALVLAAGVAWAVLIAPTGRRWRDREAAIEAARDRVARLRGLEASGPAILAAAQAAAAPTAGVLQGRTVPLVASELQSLLQELARTARVSVNRLDVRPPEDSAAGTEGTLEASVAATTDIYGLADLLTRLQAHPAALRVASLQVEPNPVLRGQLLQLSLGVQAPWVVTP